MSNHDNTNGHSPEAQWEARINALLDGELDEAEAAALKQEAEQNQALARAIVEAHALQSQLDELEVERAPASLRKRLADIPKSEAPERMRWFGMPRWVAVGAMAAAPLAVIAMVMMQAGPAGPGPQAPKYTEQEILQARQDVRTAFTYLDRINDRAAREIRGELADQLSDGVNDNVTKHMPFTHSSEQEENS